MQTAGMEPELLSHNLVSPAQAFLLSPEPRVKDVLLAEEDRLPAGRMLDMEGTVQGT